MINRGSEVKIHACCEVLNIDEDLYLVTNFPHTSIAPKPFTKADVNLLEQDEADRIIRDLCGYWKPGGDSYDDLGVRPGMAHPVFLYAISALWGLCTNFRYDPCDKALNEYLYRTFGVSAMRFVAEAQVSSILIALLDLSLDHKKRGVK